MIPIPEIKIKDERVLDRVKLVVEKIKGSALEIKLAGYRGGCQWIIYYLDI